MRLIRDGEKVYGGGERGRLYTYHYAVTTRMTSALRWAAMRANLMFHNRRFPEITVLITGIRHLPHVLTVPPKKACLLCATPAGMDLYILTECSPLDFRRSSIMRDKVTRPCPQTQLLKSNESRSGFEPRSLCLPA